MLNQELNGPNWDNTNEYKSLHDDVLAQDLTAIKDILQSLKLPLEALAKTIPPASTEEIQASAEQIAQALHISQQLTEAMTLIYNLSVYCSCILSVEADHNEAKKFKGQLQSIITNFSSCSQTHRIWLTYLDQMSIDKYYSDPIGHEEKFAIERERMRKATLLSLKEEDMLNELEANGPDAFGNLYTDLSSTISCHIKTPNGESKDMGMAQAVSLLESPHRDTRKAAYEAMNQEWGRHRVTFSTIINSLAGWRLAVDEKRSHTQPQHFLDETLHSNRIESQTLNSMMQVIENHKSFAQSMFRRQAAIMGVKQFEPWDRFVPCPTTDESTFSFPQAISLIKDALASVDSSMADFVQLMVDNRWIEGSNGPKKRPGAYCTQFAKSRTPRVYMTYNGSMKDVVTLAHELGHAYHNWVMKDIPLRSTSYPMTLAETASIFCQTLVMDHMLDVSPKAEQKQMILWNIARDVEGFLLNIPVRFSFEKKVYEERKNGPLLPTRLDELMRASWQQWYGNTLSDYEDLFWASKLHFHIAGTRFYNYPYSFGYLFAIGVYSQKDRLGSSFLPAYQALLRDTGKFTAEDIASRHLNVDLTKEGFWEDSIKQVKEKLKYF